MVSQIETHALNDHRPFCHTIEGLIQVFTGPHRSFFTSVMAQSLRLAGQGTPVLVVQFLKGGIQQGPDHPVQLGQHLTWLRCDLPRCIDTPHIEEAEAIALQALWDYTKTAAYSGDYALIVLDELSLATKFGLIPEAEVLDFLHQRPSQVDVILTGPDMPESILNIADQITELRRSYRS
ncbi:MAG TPA: P-loop NTPase family protein [Candidatus Obscuribacterales bacterium]